MRIHRFLVPAPELPEPLSPALLKREPERLESRQNRIAETIASFAGSMLFVYRPHRLVELLDRLVGRDTLTLTAWET